MRMIDGDALLNLLDYMSADEDNPEVRNISKTFTLKELAYYICTQPKVYDVRDVVRELKSEMEDTQGGTNMLVLNRNNAFDEAIKIVKSGAMYEKW